MENTTPSIEVFKQAIDLIVNEARSFEVYDNLLYYWREWTPKEKKEANNLINDLFSNIIRKWNQR